MGLRLLRIRDNWREGDRQEWEEVPLVNSTPSGLASRTIQQRMYLRWEVHSAQEVLEAWGGAQGIEPSILFGVTHVVGMCLGFFQPREGLILVALSA